MANPLADLWLTIPEMDGLPGLPGTARGKLKASLRNRWESRPRAKGKGLEYRAASLPQEAQAALQTRVIDATLARFVAENPPPAPVVADLDPVAERAAAEDARRRRRHEGQTKFTALAPDAPKRLRALAREWCVNAYYQIYREQGLKKGATRALLVERVNTRALAVPEKHREYLPLYEGTRTLDEATLERWISAYEADGIWGLTDGYGTRQGHSLIDAQPALYRLVLGQMFAQPQSSGKDLWSLIRAQADDLAAQGVTRLPSVRAVQLYRTGWVTKNRALWTLMTNPGRHKNHYQVAFGSQHQAVTGLNQLWEMDSTPGDWLLTDGRHSVIGCLDLYSRRLTLFVSKSSSSHAVGQCFRRAALAWGLPERVRTDNGKDYVSDYFTRVLEHLEIGQTLCLPFKSEQKGSVERVLKTMAYGLLKLLPGYIGHNVAEAQAIRARATFAERLMTPGELVEVDLSAADLQRLLDDWATNVYHQDAHAGEGMAGTTPFLKAAAWAEPIRTVDERALDALLLPLEGTRTVGKKGIRLDNHLYIAATLARYIGESVYLRRDEADLGRIYVYGEDRFLCVAECPELTGISKAEVAAAAHVEQRALIREQTAELKQFKKDQSKNAAQIVLKARAKAAGKLVDFPKAETAHDTPMLRAGLEAAQAAQAPGLREDTPEQMAAKQTLAAEMREAASNVHRLSEDTPKGRYMKWLRIDNERIRGDRHHDAATLRWWAEIYPKTAEWRTQQMLAADFPADYDIFSGVG